MKSRIWVSLLGLSLGCLGHAAPSPRSNDFLEGNLNTPIKVLLVRGLDNAQVRPLSGELYLFNENGRGWKIPSRKAAITTFNNVDGSGGFLVNGTKIKTQSLYVRGRDPSERISFQTEVFRGTLKLTRENDRFYVTNLISLEQYLIGVVSGEMQSSWGMEALKAQVVAARTYAMYMLKHPRDSRFTVERTTNDQVYSGTQDEPQSIRRAVAETTGQFLSMHGGPIKSFYHSRCGGSTESPHEVWSKNVKGPRSKGLNVQCEGCQSKPYLWQTSIRMQDLLLAMKAPNALSVRVASVDRSPSGRVSKVKLQVGSQTKTLSGDELRALLGYTRVKSTQLNLEMDRQGMNVKGVGAGHGVGMCQWGANFLAQKGKSYKDILRHYYPGAELVAK